MVRFKRVISCASLNSSGSNRTISLFGDHITCSFPKDTNRVFDDPATLHTTVDVLDPHASPRKLLIEDLLFVGERATTRFLEMSSTFFSV